MANGDAFEDAVRLANETPTLDVGCHLVLVEGRSLLTNRLLPKGPRELLIELLKGSIDPYRELRVQLEKIIGAGLRPTHLDSHKHTHIVPGVFRAAVRLAHEFEVPFVRLPLDTTLPIPTISRQFLRKYYGRLAADCAVKMTDHFMGFRLTGSLTEQTFASALSLLPDGTTEFMCHPGFLGPELKVAKTRLKESRVKELEALVSPAIRQIMTERSICLGVFGEDPARMKR